MKKIILVLGLLALSACGDSSSSSSKNQKGSQRQTEAVVTNEYLRLVNEHRIALKLRPLVYSEVIEDVAINYTVKMSNRGWISHMGLGSRCKEIRQGLGHGGRCGEIVASGQQDAKAVFEAWLNSPPHREAIEDPDYTHTGLGYTANRNGKIFWSQMFMEL